ncbi:MAG: glycosyltransferase family 4 protein [Clostridium chrysemydis]|uniref:glycosyltransferase family 4 protein n=1 Tax=Clostridium TaxID=1485 RepID=UPI003F332371
MKIAIDGRPLIEKKTGIGYYLDYLLRNILENDKENEYFLFSDRKVYFEGEKYKNLKIIEDDKGKFKKTIWYLIKTKSLCNKYKIDVFWGTQHVLPFNMSGLKQILTVHDLVAFDFKDTMSTYNKIINKLLIPKSIKKADKIIAVSKSTKERINYHFPKIKNDKIKVIYEDVVVEKSKDPINDSLLRDKGIEKKQYLMFLGTIEPRKNIKTLIKALDIINKSENLKLAICGKYGWKCDEERNLIEKNKKNIVFFDYVTDDEKNYLMKNSFAFIFPSLYEGFGLPVLEAMRNGTIAIVSDNTSLKELIEIDELKFDTMDYEELADKILNLYKDKELYNKALGYCEKREKDFSWDNIAKEYIDEITRW